MNIRALLKELRISLVATLCLAVLLCGLYPMFIWGLGQGLFPREANGSLVAKGGRTVGSSLLVQGFAGAKYFHPRPSAAGSGYDAASSGGSNLGPLSRCMDFVHAEVFLTDGTYLGLLGSLGEE